MTKQIKLFKESPSYDSFNTYQQHIEDSLLPFGFGESADEVIFEIKRRLFAALYQETLNSGPSFDAEILFSSIMSDFNETFDNVLPSLLTLQRAKQ
ncbi:hypothetical protein Xoosp13_158 [Xanthomonas phage Xoo-sp13]|nr:hypothetical protein Xoosp13_158 [Xanthomonas phage Xoo-sp13]